MKLNSIILIFLAQSFSLSFCSEKPDNWYIWQNQGPLKSLAFTPVTIDKEKGGKVCGWLHLPSAKDSVYACINFHKTGYSIRYTVPENELSKITSLLPHDSYYHYFPQELKELQLPWKIYYWKSSKAVKKFPTDEDHYEYEGSWWSRVDEEFHQARLQRDQLIAKKELTETDQERINKLTDLINQKASHYDWLYDENKKYYVNQDLKAAFKGNYTVYLSPEVPGNLPITPEQTDFIKQIMETQDFAQYRNLSDAQKKKILSYIPAPLYNALQDWLKDKIKGSGFGAQEEFDVINQYITEAWVQWVRNYIRFGGTPSIDTYKIFEDIEELSQCPASLRTQMNTHLLNRNEESRISGMTAKGRIECNPGLLQWD